jgi:hypothetical protein
VVLQLSVIFHMLYHEYVRALACLIFEANFRYIFYLYLKYLIVIKHSIINGVSIYIMKLSNNFVSYNHVYFFHGRI